MTLEFKLSPEALVIDGSLVPVRPSDWDRSELCCIPPDNSLGLEHRTKANGPRTSVSREVFETLLRLALKLTQEGACHGVHHTELPYHRKGTKAESIYDTLMSQFSQTDNASLIIEGPRSSPTFAFAYRGEISLPPESECRLWLDRAGICNAVLNVLESRTDIARVSMIAAEGAVAATVFEEIADNYDNIEVELLVSDSDDPNYARARRDAHANRDRILQAAKSCSRSNHGLSLDLVKHAVLPTVHGVGLHDATGEMIVAEVGIAGYDEDGQLTCWATDTPFETGKRGALVFDLYCNYLTTMRKQGETRRVWPS